MPPIVILIDAENGPASKASTVRAEAQKRGEIVIQRVYANTQALRGWQKAIERYAPVSAKLTKRYLDFAHFKLRNKRHRQGERGLSVGVK